MKRKTLALTDRDGEVRELTAADMRSMGPAEDVLPPNLVSILPERRPGRRGPGKRPAKQSVTLRIDADVLERYRSTGKGWQTRMTRALEEASRDFA